MDVFDFDLTPQEQPVALNGKKYLVREASEDAARRYRNTIFRASRLTENGQIQAGDGLADAEPLLVSLCLFQESKATTPSGGPVWEAVSLGFVMGLPARVVKPLFRWVQEHSDLGEKTAASPSANGEAGPKNLLAATTETSASAAS